MTGRRPGVTVRGAVASPSASQTSLAMSSLQSADAAPLLSYGVVVWIEPRRTRWTCESGPPQRRTTSRVGYPQNSASITAPLSPAQSPLKLSASEWLASRVTNASDWEPWMPPPWPHTSLPQLSRMVWRPRP